MRGVADWTKAVSCIGWLHAGTAGTDWCVFRHRERFPQAAQHGPCPEQEQQEAQSGAHATRGQQPTFASLTGLGMFRRPQTSAESGGRIRKYRVGTNPTRNRSQWDAAVDLPGSLARHPRFQLSDAFLSASPRSCRSSHAGPSASGLRSFAASALLPLLPLLPPSIPLSPTFSPLHHLSSSTVDLDHH